MHNMMVRIQADEDDVIDDSLFYNTTKAVKTKAVEEADVEGQKNNSNMIDYDNVNKEVSCIVKKLSCGLDRKEDYKFAKKDGRICTMLAM